MSITAGTPVPDPRVVEVDVELRSSGTLGSEVGTDLVVAPDGSAVAFVSRGADRRGRLNYRRLADAAVTELPGTEGARGPFFSPDSRWIGFWADRALKKVAVDGGSPVVLAETAICSARAGPTTTRSSPQRVSARRRVFRPRAARRAPCST